MAAKKSLAVLTDLWRRHIWRDARTVNVIASAAQHRSSSILLAVSLTCLNLVPFLHCNHAIASVRDIFFWRGTAARPTCRR